MATISSNNTDRTIEQLTKQIAELSINLAEKQISPTSKPIYYSDSNLNRYRSDNNNNQWDAICYYCESKGHFIKDCHQRKEDNRNNFYSNNRPSSYSNNNSHSNNNYRSNDRRNNNSYSYNRSRS